MTRWRPSVGDRVARRWKAWLGEGVVESIGAGHIAHVRWTDAEGGALLGFHLLSHLTRAGMLIDSGPGRDRPDLFVVLGAEGRA